MPRFESVWDLFADWIRIKNVSAKNVRLPIECCAQLPAQPRCVRVDMTAPKPKPKPRGGQRRPFARQHSSSKDVSRKRFEQQLEDDMIYFDVFPVCTDWKPYKQKNLWLCEYIDIFYFQMMISPIKRSRSSVSCAGRGCIFCSFVVSRRKNVKKKCSTTPTHTGN